MQGKSSNLDKLKELGQKITAARQNRAHVEGRIQSIEEQLAELHLDSIIKAKKEIRALNKQVEDINKEMTAAIQAIEDKMYGRSI